MCDGWFCGWQMNCNRWHSRGNSHYFKQPVNTRTLMTMKDNSISCWWTINGYCSSVRFIKGLVHFMSSNKHSVIPFLITHYIVHSIMAILSALSICETPWKCNKLSFVAIHLLCDGDNGDGMQIDHDLFKLKVFNVNMYMNCGRLWWTILKSKCNWCAGGGSYYLYFRWDKLYKFY